MPSEENITPTEQQWDNLYKNSMGAPRYPNGHVVRWLFGTFPRQRAADYNLLDLGTGMGRHALLMAREGYQVSGTDVSATSIHQARCWAKEEGLDISFQQASAEHQPFADGTYDGIMSYAVLYYLSKVKFDGTVQEIHRLLKVGGSAFIMIKNDRDVRRCKGDMTAPHEYTLTGEEPGMPWNNERGMTLTLLPKSEIESSFSDFSEVVIEEITSTLAGGAHLEAAWLIYARK